MCDTKLSLAGPPEEINGSYLFRAHRDGEALSSKNPSLGADTWFWIPISLVVMFRTDVTTIVRRA